MRIAELLSAEETAKHVFLFSHVFRNENSSGDLKYRLYIQSYWRQRMQNEEIISCLRFLKVLCLSVIACF